MLLIMHDCEPRGYFTLNGGPITDIEAARMIGVTLDEYTFGVTELDKYHVMSRDSHGIIFNRRMARDEHKKQVVNIRQRRCRAKQEESCHASVTPLSRRSSSSSSSSSSISISKKEKNLWSSDDDRDGFNSFWKEYPKKVQKQTAIKAWKKLKPTDGFHTLLETILKDVRSRANSDEWTKDNLQFCPYPASYLNGRRWEDEVPQPRDPMGFLKFAKPDLDEEDEPGYNPEFRAPRRGDKT
jgi:hypothetical protein